jgi:hypothetical protein
MRELLRSKLKEAIMKICLVLTLCLVLSATVVFSDQPTRVIKSLPIIEITGVINPPQANAVPFVKTNWNVKLELIYYNPDWGHQEMEVRWTRMLTADSSGRFYYETAGYTDLREPRLRITVVGGWAYEDEVKEVKVNTSGEYTLHFNMSRR